MSNQELVLYCDSEGTCQSVGEAGRDGLPFSAFHETSMLLCFQVGYTFTQRITELVVRLGNGDADAACKLTELAINAKDKVAFARVCARPYPYP